jgi:subtilisin family serine protease
MRKILLCSLLAISLFVQAALASDMRLGNKIKIAVIDTGISALAIDSGHLEPGYNYLEENMDTEDQIGHGTAIAALLTGASSARITGISPQASLVPLVYQTRDKNDQVQEGNQEAIARAIRDAVDLYGCRVINISVGTTRESTSLREAVEYAEEKNVVIVSSVGNDNQNNPQALYYPAAYPTVIGVGSVSQRGRVSDFSQRNESVMLVAPGEKIWTASKDGRSMLTNGTSFASAYVSGAAAALLSTHPELSAAGVRQMLCGSAADILAAGYDTGSGWGILHMDAALEWAAEGRNFRDIPADSWCFAAVNDACHKGWLTGTTPVSFSPESPLTRAMLWTALWRMEGNTALSNGDSWYAAAQQWVQSKHVSDGTNPDGQITREQLATILWRYAGSPAATANLSAFSDTGKINGYAAVAMEWAIENGILGGMGDGTLNPQGQATRAQAAAVLQRYCENKI